MNRRGFLLGLGASALAAPAVVKAASLMPVKAPPLIAPPRRLYPGYGPGNNLLTIDQITREAIRLWLNSNEFIRHMNFEYDKTFEVGTSLRVRLPGNFVINQGPSLIREPEAHHGKELLERRGTRWS